MKFLIDECLSPDLATIAWQRGFHCVHVTRIGLQSRNDWTIVQRAIEDDWVLVTHNTADFKRLVGREEVHSGLICFNVAPGLMRIQVQKLLFRHAVDEMTDEDPINTVVEITLTDDFTVNTTRYTWPP